MKTLKLLASVALFCSLNAKAQQNNNQDIGINMAGLLIKNQATVVPSLLYKYAFKNYQLRIQLALDGKLDSKYRKGNLNNSGSFGSFTMDTLLNYNPGRNIRYGIMAGIQRNKKIDQTDFSYYYGVDLIFMMNDLYESAEGVILQSNGGFDSSKQRVNITIKNKNKFNTFGIGLPIGVTYNFGKRFYGALEAKFILAYQIGHSSQITETSQIQNFTIFTTKTESGTDYKGFDFGIKPLTGLNIGMYF